MSKRSLLSFTSIETIRWRHSLSFGEDVTLEQFLREVQFFAWILLTRCHDYLEFMDQRNMAARVIGLTRAPQRSVKLWFADGRKLGLEMFGTEKFWVGGKPK